MQYFVAFLEGVITFISPCLLPMLPVYISYFAGGGERSSHRTLSCAFGFVAGFTAVFVAMGALAGAIGGFLARYQSALNAVCGLVIIFFGLNYLGVIRINLFSGSRREMDKSNLNLFSSMLFGVIFSIGWTPCVGAFLGSALMLASGEGSVLAGVVMLVLYSLGLGIPFILSAVLIDTLKSAFGWIKKNYKVINLISGILLIIIGILMATGTFGSFVAALA